MIVIKKNIKFLCKLNKIRIKELEKELNIKNKGLSRAYFYKNVKLSQLENIANRFNVPLNLLIYVDLELLNKEEIYNLISKEIAYEIINTKKTI